MSFPGFPPTLPALPSDAPELSEEDRAYVNGLKPHQRAEAIWMIRTLNAKFNKLLPSRGDFSAVQPMGVNSAGRPEGDCLPINPAEGMTQALRACEIDRENREMSWVKRVAGGRA